ncbi:MAG: S41 family peptidase [Defluviitaleaceae bacterium]|nr:S41 family peptidase [Defluviitaleaceae bacterium]
MKYLKPFKKFFIAAIILVMITGASRTAFAADGLTNDDKNQIAAYMIYQVMALIEDEYMGGDVTPEELYDAAMHGMTSALDPYSQYFTDAELNSFMAPLSGEYFGIGVMIQEDADGQAVIAQVVADSPAEKAGLKAGDIIISIDGVTADAGLDGMISALSVSGDPSTVVVKRGSGTLTFTVEKTMLTNQTVFVDAMGDVLPSAKDKDTSSLRYMAITAFGENTADEFRDAVAQMKDEGVTGLVIDLRGNGGGLIDAVLDICRQMVPKGVIMSTLEKSGLSTFYMSDLEETPFKDVVILTDAYTASASEIFAAAMQDSKAATIIGETTYGKGVMQSLYPLPTGGAFKLTTAQDFRRSGAKINGVGVKPDIVITHPPMVNETDKNMISEVKKILSYIGYPVSSDGEALDDETKAAIEQFQADCGLPVTGYPYSKTLTLLNYYVYSTYYGSGDVLQKAYDVLTGQE